MRRMAAAMAVITAVGTTVPAAARQAFRPLTVREYRDKMKAGWVGQMVGVSWGAPTEFRARGWILAESEMPKWQPAMVNDAFGQDDLYVEMTFLRTLELHGLEVSRWQAGRDFAESRYGLAHANAAGRENLRRGIAPPDSGHPRYNAHADDIDYQIEADFSGLIAPGLPNVAIALGEKFGRLMNYGDGLYGGQFVGGMYAEAFLEKDPVKIVESGLRCLPPGSQYAEAIRDVLRWHRENPRDWQKTWALVNRKYQENPAYRRASCEKGAFDIDAKLNGAYVALGLLYGERDPEKTITIAARCGQDSDCNPSTAAGVLFTTIGFSNLPGRFTAELNQDTLFSHTAYNFAGVVEVCEQLARQVVARSAGKIAKDANGDDVFVIPVRAPKSSPLEQSWAPGPPAPGGR